MASRFGFFGWLCARESDASIAARKRDYHRQQTLTDQAIIKAQSFGSRLLMARAQLMRGTALEYQSQLEQATMAFSAARQIFEDAGDRHGAANAQDDLGIVLQKRGDLAGARQAFAQARDNFRHVGDQNGLRATQIKLKELERGQKRVQTDKKSLQIGH